MAKKETASQRKEREKTFRKANQKIAIQGIGRSTNQEKQADSDRIKLRGTEEVEKATEVLNSTGTSLQESVQGQFGKKVTEVFDQQQKTLDKF